MSRLTSLAFLAALAGGTVSAYGATTPPTTEHDRGIAPQPLADALAAFARKSGLKLIYASDLAMGRRSNGAPAGLPPTETLQRILSGTGLTARWLNKRTVSIAREYDAAEFQGVVAPSELSVGSAQTSASADTTGPEQQNSQDETHRRLELEEVVVTGSRLKRTSSDEGPAPVIAFDRAKIDQLGVSNLADVFNYLPQQPFSTIESQDPGGARPVQLRGLGFGNTLVLINGRRTVTSALTSSLNYFDLNTIPLAAVERIELLPSSASAVYGSDAVGGVVNVILKQEIDHPQIDFHYGAAAGGAEEERGSGSFGYSDDRFRSAVILDYFHRGQLLGEDRDLFSNMDYSRFGGPDRRVTTCDPGTVSSISGVDLPGLSSSFAAIPVGSTGEGLTPANFRATAGQQNLCSVNSFRSVVPADTRYGAIANAQLDLSDKTTAFAEALYSRIENTILFAPSAATLAVPATNPFNPFGVPVNVSYLFSGVGPESQVAKSQSLQEVAGVRGNVAGWDWEFSAVAFQSDGWVDNAEGSIDTTRVNAALATSDPTQALNVFQDGPGGSQLLLASLVADPLASRVYVRSQSTQIGAFARRDLFELPAGPVQLVAGSEWRAERQSLKIQGTTFDERGERNTDAVYSELRIPIIGGAMHVPFAQQITVTGAGRYDHYSDFGGTFNPQYGVEWRISSPVLIRASYGTAFRAPSLYDLYAPERTQAEVLQDPRRNNETATPVAIFGGNPNLQPEESTSLITGFVLTPAEALRVSGSYWKISQNRRTNILDPLAILANENLFPDRVVRAPPTAADIAAGLPGQLISINASTINYGRLDTSGVDLDLAYTIDTQLGKYLPSVSATRVQQYSAADFPNSPSIDRVGVADYNGTIPRWRGSASLGWAQRAYSASISARYNSGYADTNFNVRNGLHVDSQTLVDAQGAVEFGKIFKAFKTSSASPTWYRGLVIRAGVINLFNKQPPFSDVVQQGYDPSQADVRQRFWYVNVSESF